MVQTHQSQGAGNMGLLERSVLHPRALDGTFDASVMAQEAGRATHIDRIREQHQDDLPHSVDFADLPWPVARKYPDAGREWP